MADLYPSPCSRHCLESSWTFFRIKTHDLWSGDDSGGTVSFLDASFLENLFCSPGVASGGGSSCCFTDQFVYFCCFMFFFFWLRASLMSRLASNIMLLQRRGVIDIRLILIYSHYRKENTLVFFFLWLYARPPPLWATSGVLDVLHMLELESFDGIFSLYTEGWVDLFLSFL